VVTLHEIDVINSRTQVGRQLLVQAQAAVPDRKRGASAPVARAAMHALLSCTQAGPRPISDRPAEPGWRPALLPALALPRPCRCPADALPLPPPSPSPSTLARASWRCSLATPARSAPRCASRSTPRWRSGARRAKRRSFPVCSSSTRCTCWTSSASPSSTGARSRGGAGGPGGAGGSGGAGGQQRGPAPALVPPAPPAPPSGG
jgi:hypothetical protein